MLSLKAWLWRGTFEPTGEKLEVWAGLDGVDQSDMMTEVSALIEKSWNLLEQAKELERRRSPHGAETSVEREIKQIARSMLPVLDAIDRVLDCTNKIGDANDEFKNWIKSVEGVSSRLYKTMSSIGLTPISSVGAEVDLEIHDVVSTLRTNRFPENTVVEVRQKGYYFRGRLLRDAKVVVALPA